MKRSNSRAKYVLGGFVLAAIVATTTACGSDDKTDTGSQSADTVHAVTHAAEPPTYRRIHSELSCSSRFSSTRR